MLVGNAKFDDMPSVAVLVAAIQQSHRNFVVRLIDHVFEQVLRGMEENDFKDAQRRVSIMKFISECYNFKVIHTDALFSMLYVLINWDLQGNCEIAHVAELDLASNCFRIRLVCTLLDSLGKFFMARKRRLLLDRFFVFFQRYILRKNYMLMDLEFMLLDTFDSLRAKNMPRIENLAQAE